MNQLPALLALISTFAVGCGVQGSAAQGGQAGSEHERAQHVGQQSPWTGTWRLERLPAQTQPGFRIEVAFDSLLNGNVYGRLVSFFSGNVGIDPRGYSPIVVELNGDSVVTFTVSPTGSGSAPALYFSGVLETDTLTLRRLAIGTDTVSANGVRWFLLKQRF